MFTTLSLRTTPRCPSKEDRRKSRGASKRNNNNNNHSDSGGPESGLHGHVTTKKEIIDQVVGGHHIPGQHMSSNDLTSGLLGQQNSLTDSYIQPGKKNLNSIYYTNILTRKTLII